MKKHFQIMAFLALMILTTLAQAVTVYYQPTPYPLKKMDGTDMSQNLNIVHIWNGWMNSYYPSIQELQENDILQIGGWGDDYASVIRFDLTGLPRTADSANLYLWALPSGATNPSQVSLYPITSDWDVSTIAWYNFPSFSSGYYWPISTAVNTWRGYTVTGWYNDWKNNVRPDKGIMVYPYNNDGQQRFDKFASSRVVAPTDARYLGTRPILGLTFTPTLQLKMPLPGNYRWLLTNEIGGYECMGKTPWPDEYHQDITGNYFSIDITWNNVYNGSGPSPYGEFNTPVLAAANGKVVFAGQANPEVGNGYYVVINHNNDTVNNTGFSTRYIHLKDIPKRKNGVILQTNDVVVQGDQIGIMGTTGTLPNGSPSSTGVHLHFGVRYNNSGLSTVSELTKVVMEGKILKSYQTECSVNSSGVPTNWVRFYSSTNPLTGN
jgi:hypothetical protein